MGRRETFHSFSQLVYIEGPFTHEFVTYVYETQDWSGKHDDTQSHPCGKLGTSQKDTFTYSHAKHTVFGHRVKHCCVMTLGHLFH
jgi:hypothetical protein